MGASFSLLLMSCGGTENSLIDEQAASEPQQERYDEQGLDPQTIRYEIKISDPQSAEEKVATENIAPLTTENEAAIPHDVVPPAPMSPGANFLPGVHEVAPWLANYAGSYGLLPSRLGDAPTFYSLDVHPRSSQHLAKSTDD